MPSAPTKKEGAQAIGRSRGGLTKQVHALVEAIGNLARWSLTPGQAADLSDTEPWLEVISASADATDNAYDTQALLDTIAASGAEVVILPGANRTQPRTFDRHTYEGRNLIERFFCRIQHLRRVATRYHKIAAAWIRLA